VSGRKALYVAEGECTAIDGMPEEEALALVAELAQRIVDPAFHYRHRWQVGDLVVWDNAQVQHLAIKDYALPERRLLHRTQTKGSVPV
jgi:taurine dioxygenase